MTRVAVALLAFTAGAVAWAVARAPLGRWVAWLFVRVQY